MGNTQIKVGIIGCGGIANSHAAGYKANGVEIAAVTDVSREAAEKLAAQHPGCKVFEDCKALIKSGLVSAVSVCTPPVAHEEAVVFALQNNISVLCEKPFAHTVESGKRICEAAAKSKATLMLAFRHRFLPAMVKIREMIQAGEIGAPVFMNNIFCGPSFAMKDRWFTKKKIAGGGCLLDTNSHSVDLFRFLIGEVTDQKAVFHRHFEGTDVEDAGILSVKAANGAVGSLTSAFVAGCGKAFVDIMGQKGEILYDYFEMDKIKKKLTDDKDWTVIPVKSSWGFEDETAHFKAVLEGKEKLSCGAADGLRALEIIQAVY
jgi:predicted dehydrogenase